MSGLKCESGNLRFQLMWLSASQHFVRQGWTRHIPHPQEAFNQIRENRSMEHDNSV